MYLTPKWRVIMCVSVRSSVRPDGYQMIWKRINDSWNFALLFSNIKYRLRSIMIKMQKVVFWVTPFWIVATPFHHYVARYHFMFHNAQLFFLISVQKVKEYRLSSGTVSRNEGYVEKGTTTDVSKIEIFCKNKHKILNY